MKQRACIAMAIALDPALIIADEPTSALDVVVQRAVAETLMDVKERIGASVILIGHDLGLQAQLVDRLGVMYRGRLVETGPVRDLFQRPAAPVHGAAHPLGAVDPARAATRSPAPPGVPASWPPPPTTWRRPGSRRCARSGPTTWWRSRDRAVDAPDRGGRRRRVAGAVPLLEMRHAGKTFRSGSGPDVVALDDFSLVLDESPPRVVALAGESGSGKSTAANLVLGFLQPDGRRGPLPRATPSAGSRARRAPELPAGGPGDHPGPVLGVQPVLPGRARVRHGHPQLPDRDGRRRREGEGRRGAQLRRAVRRPGPRRATRTSSAAASASASWSRARSCCGPG